MTDYLHTFEIKILVNKSKTPEHGGFILVSGEERCIQEQRISSAIS